jgi:DNA (cytosine-5)-methyltransferase 1
MNYSYEKMKVKDLIQICKDLSIPKYSKKKKYELIEMIHSSKINNTVDNVIDDLQKLTIDTIEKHYNVLDLFCGCGGLTNGFKDIFNIVCAIDSWEVAIESYKQNHDHLALCKDLRNFEPNELEILLQNKPIDIIIGGPPCQSYSMAGKRDVNDSRANLFLEYYKFIEYFNPKIFVMENVMGILSIKNKEGGLLITTIMNILEENYVCKIHKLYAADFEVPQLRRRVIIIGIRKDLSIDHITLQTVNKDNRIPVSSVLQPKEEIESSYYLSEKALEGIRRKKERMKLEGKGFGAQILQLNKPCYTIPSRYWKDGYDALVQYSEKEIRRLTILELKRIQTLGDEYILCGSKKDQIIQIGNAVASRFAHHLAHHILRILHQE